MKVCIKYVHLYSGVLLHVEYFIHLNNPRGFVFSLLLQLLLFQLQLYNKGLNIVAVTQQLFIKRVTYI